jgi:hypothetical protein
MNIPGAFTLVDVDFNRTEEPALLLRSAGGVDTYMRWSKLTPSAQSELYDIMGTIDASATDWTYATDAISITGTGVTPLAATEVPAGTYNLNVNVDGAGAVDVPVVVTAGMTFQQMLDDAFLPSLKVAFPAAKAYWTQVNATTLNLVVETGTVGTTGAVVVVAGTSDDLITAINGTSAWACAVAAGVAGANGASTLPAGVIGSATINFTALPAVTPTTALGITAGNYTFEVAVDGGTSTVYTVAATGTDTMTTMAALMAAQLAGKATVAAVGTGFVITTLTPGSAGSVAVTIPASSGTDLVGAINTSLTATHAVTTVPGADDWMTQLENVKSLTGFPLLQSVGNGAFVEKGPKPTALGKAVQTYVYWDGAAWKYYVNDVTVGPTVNPPANV